MAKTQVTMKVSLNDIGIINIPYFIGDYYTFEAAPAIAFGTLEVFKDIGGNLTFTLKNITHSMRRICGYV